VEKRRWTEEEIEILKQYYRGLPRDELEKKLNRSFSSIRHKAQRLRIRRTNQKILPATTLSKDLSITEASYIAGFLDGEGTITIGVRRVGGFGFYPFLLFSNTNLDVMKFLSEKLNRPIEKDIDKRGYKPRYKIVIFRINDIIKILFHLYLN
jgi:hypothetical protein